MDNSIARAHSISIYEQTPELTIEAMKNETFREASFVIQEDLDGIGGVIYQIQRSDGTIVQGTCSIDVEAHHVWFRIPLNALTEVATMTCNLVFYTKDSTYYDEQLEAVLSGDTLVFVEDTQESSSSAVGSSGIISSFPFYIHVNDSNINSDSVLETALTDMLTTTANNQALYSQMSALFSNMSTLYETMQTATTAAQNAANAAETQNALSTTLYNNSTTLYNNMNDLYSDVEGVDFSTLATWMANVESGNDLVFIEDTTVEEESGGEESEGGES